MKKLGMIGLAVAGLAAFVVFISGVSITLDLIKAGTYDITSEWAFWMAIVGCLVAGACGTGFEHLRLSTGGEKAMPSKKKSPTASVNEEKLVGGVLLVGVAIFEFSTNYLADNFLVPYQQTRLLRNVFSSGLFPLVIGLWGLGMIGVGIKPFLDKMNRNEKKKKSETEKGEKVGCSHQKPLVDSNAPNKTFQCPECDRPYRLGDYQPDADEIFCSWCHEKLPESPRNASSQGSQ